ncbi:restriction endonuclease [Zeaxanthinibacter sp. PT1]|uniref:McrC family protein n=1 Tax=Zeaxanthinibacter TaxID=561554 RepID=UPI00234A7511|nr:restriction endonuclease [Zeaxanthinibacter sp. PT1]MDC6350461.1 restriction endonuclease [Zeaxanthinibacter sp. PT1]
MRKPRIISVFEHERLRIGDKGFTQVHLDAMLRLNDYHLGAYFEPISKGVKFSQYVGVIQVDGLIIEIHPKADKDEDSTPWRGVLLNMLKACGKLKASTTGAANVNRRHLNLLEVYFEFYLREIEGLTRMGLIKQYRNETKNVKALKGKLEFAGNLRQNLIHKERFYTTHQVYDTNHLLHQVLNHALEIVEEFTKGTRLYDFVKRVQLNFPEVDSRRISAKQLSKIKLNRKSAPYNYALELARLIILNYSPDIKGGQERMLSLLFDMNELWEIYIYKQVLKAVQGTDIKVIPQDSKPFWGPNSLRPDIVLQKDSKTYIIDTKWKRPMNKSASIQDLRQMYAYCRFWNAEKAMLLYPGTPTNQSFKKYETDDYHKNGEEYPAQVEHACKLGFVSILNPNDQLDDMIGSKVLYLVDI